MAEWIRKIRNAGISFDRINIFGLIVLLIGAVICFSAGFTAKKIFPGKQNAAKVIKLVSLVICVTGFIITIYF